MITAAMRPTANDSAHHNGTHEVVSTNHKELTKHGVVPSHVNFCQCRINQSGCLACRRWTNTINGIEARRAGLFRRQSIAVLVRGTA